MGSTAFWRVPSFHRFCSRVLGVPVLEFPSWTVKPPKGNWVFTMWRRVVIHADVLEEVISSPSVEGWRSFPVWEPDGQHVQKA